MSSADELRLQGNAAVNAGNFQEAIGLYSRALVHDGNNAILLHNRALAYLRNKDFKKALDDADKAISIDSRFVKAYSTKGNALREMRRSAEAADAFRAGLAIDARHEGCQQGLAYTQAAPRTTYTGPRAGADVDFPPTTAAVPEDPSQQSGLASTIVRGLRSAVLVQSVLYLVSGAGAASLLLPLTAAAHVGVILSRHRLPTMSTWKEWMERVVLDGSCLSIALPVALMTLRRPHVLALLAAQAPVDMWYALESIHGTIARFVPSLASLLSRAGLFVATQLIGAEGASSSSRRTLILHRLLELSGMGLIATMLLLILEVVTPWRNLTAILMIGQVVQMQYMSSPYIRRGFSAVHEQVLALTRHRLCPSILASTYATSMDKLYYFVTAPMRQAREAAAGGGAQGAQAGAGGMMGAARSALSSCTIQ